MKESVRQAQPERGVEERSNLTAKGIIEREMQTFPFCVLVKRDNSFFPLLFLHFFSTSRFESIPSVCFSIFTLSPPYFSLFLAVLCLCVSPLLRCQILKTQTSLKSGYKPRLQACSSLSLQYPIMQLSLAVIVCLSLDAVRFYRSLCVCAHSLDVSEREKEMSPKRVYGCLCCIHRLRLCGFV